MSETILASDAGGTYVLRRVTEDGAEKLYVNDILGSGASDQLFRERVYYFAWDGNYISRTHRIIADIDAGHLTECSFGSYTSTYTGSVPNSFRVRISGSLFLYSHSSYVNGVSHAITFVDVYGKVTPRALDNSDPVSYLIINADTGEIEDFDSDLNYYYHDNVETHLFTPE